MLALLLRAIHALALARYTTQVAQLAQSIQEAAEATKKRLHDERLAGFISEYLVTIDLVGKLVEWVLYLGDETGLSDISPEASTQIETICHKMIEERDPKIVQRLSQANYYITDASQLTTIVGQAGLRIEQACNILLEIRTNSDV